MPSQSDDNMPPVDQDAASQATPVVEPYEPVVHVTRRAMHRLNSNLVTSAIDMLGTVQRDLITGAIGVVETVRFDLYGCVVAVMTPTEVDDAKAIGTRMMNSMFDISRLRPVEGKEPIMRAPDFFARSPVTAAYAHGRATSIETLAVEDFGISEVTTEAIDEP